MDKTAIETELEKLEDDAAKVTVSTTAEEVDKRIAAAYKDLAKRYRIPGFRPGHAPRKVIDNHLGEQYGRATATEEYLNDTYLYAIDSCGVVSMSEPKVNADEVFEDGKPYTYTIDITLEPELELDSYDPVEIFMPPLEPTQAEIDAQLDILKSYQYTFEEVTDDRPVKADDFTVLDITAIRDGEKDERWCNSERIYQLGNGVLPAAFDDQLIGMKPGDHKAFTITKDDGMMAGDTDFDVTLVKIREKVFAELDDEFAKKCGADDLDDLMTKIKDSIRSEKEMTMPRLKEQRCGDALAKRLQGEPSEDYVEGVRKDIVQQLFAQLQANQMSLDLYLAQMGMDIDEFKDDLKRQATDHAKGNLAFDALARHLGIEIADEDLEKEFKAAAGADGDVEEMRRGFEQQGRMTPLIEAMKRAKASEWLVENAIVTERETPDEDEESEEGEESSEKAEEKKDEKAADDKAKAADNDEKAESKPAKKTASKSSSTKSSAKSSSTKSSSSKASSKSTASKSAASKSTKSASSKSSKTSAKADAADEGKDAE